MNDVFGKAKQYYNYKEFTDLVTELVADGKTTGPNQTDDKINFTKLNAQRMRRVVKTNKLDDNIIANLKNLPEQTWWVITEAWCGDSAQTLPVIAKMAEASEGKVDLRIVLRDENPEVIDSYLTNGGRSIPRLIVRDNNKDVFTWGPRPQLAQDLLLAWKANPNGRTHDEFEQELHTWYAKNRGVATVAEFSEELN